MSRGFELLLLIGLVLGTVLVWRQPSRAGQMDQLDIIDISRDCEDRAPRVDDWSKVQHIATAVTTTKITAKMMT
jgi:hypothetical protein